MSNYPGAHRRNFLRNAFLLGLFFRFPVSDIYARYGDQYSQAELERAASEAKEEYRSFIRQVRNHRLSSGMSVEEKKQQYEGLLRILNHTSRPEFQSLPPAEKERQLHELKPFSQEPGQSKIDYRSLYTAMFVTGGVLLGATLILKGKGAALVAATGATLTMPSWIKKAGDVLDGIMTMKDGWDIMEKVLTDSSVATAEAIHSNIYGSFANSGNFSFGDPLEGLKLDLGIRPAASNTGTGKPNSDEDDFLDIILEEGGDEAVISDPAAREAFMEKYIGKVTEMQKEALADVLAAWQQKEFKRLQEERDLSNLMQSIQNFINAAVFSKMAAEKEARVLDILLGASFQFGSMTPAGWNALAINIASVLVGGSSKSGLDKAIMASLRHIQQQLDIVIQNLGVIYENQLVMVKQLNDLMKGIDNIEKIMSVRFDEVSAKADLIFNHQKETQLQDLENRVSSAYNRLEDAIKLNDKTAAFEQLQELKILAVEYLSNNKTVTMYSAGVKTIREIKAEMFFENRYRYNLSLYSSIGLVSALATYNQVTLTGYNNVRIVHPPMFASLVESAVAWLVVADLDKQRNALITGKLLETALDSRKRLNEFAAKKKVEERQKEFLGYAGKMMDDVWMTFRGLEKKILNNSKLFSAIPTRQPNFHDLTVPGMQDRLNPTYFYNQLNDNKYFTMALDLGVIKKLEVTGKTNYAGQSKRVKIYRNQPEHTYLANFMVGSTVGSKKVKMVFENAWLDYFKGISISHEFTYDISLDIGEYTTVYHPEMFTSNPNEVYVSRKVKTIWLGFKFDKDWKKKITDGLEAKGVKIDQLIPDFNKPVYDIIKFVIHLMGQEIYAKRANLVQDAKSYLLNDRFTAYDGLGISLMVLSKLNKVITCPAISNYNFDLTGSGLFRESVAEMLDWYASGDFQQLPDSKITGFEVELGDYLDFSRYYDRSPWVVSPDPDNFGNLLAIIFSSIFEEAARKCLENVRDIAEDTGEPFLQDAISRIRWFQENYNA